MQNMVVDFFLLIIYYSHMLTQQDLQAIQQIVKIEVKDVIKNEVRDVVKNEMKDIFATKEDIFAMKEDILSIKTDITEIRKEIQDELKPIKRDIRKMQKDLNLVISTFDTEITETKVRVDRIETHLHLAVI